MYDCSLHFCIIFLDNKKMTMLSVKVKTTNKIKTIIRIYGTDEPGIVRSVVLVGASEVVGSSGASSDELLDLSSSEEDPCSSDTDEWDENDAEDDEDEDDADEKDGNDTENDHELNVKFPSSFDSSSQATLYLETQMFCSPFQ